MHITDLRTNHLENPLGFAIEQPVVSWKVVESTGTKQAFARVRVYADAEGNSVLYDSRPTADASSVGFAIDLQVEPGVGYYWDVEVTADDGDRAISEKARFEPGKAPCEDAKWIRAPFDKEIHPHMLHRFTLEQKPVRARAIVCGLGLYEMTLNGAPVTDEVLLPFYNNYQNWIQYQTFDVTDLLDIGENTADVLLGNGWWKGRFGFKAGFKEVFSDQMLMICEIRMDFADGTSRSIVSDEQWSCTRSTILESSIYDGDVIDARVQPGEEQPALLTEAPAAPLCARLSPPLKKCETVTVKEVIRTPKEETVLDFGQNFTGWFEFDCDLPEGSKVVLECGEILQNDCFYNENLRDAKERFVYISDGKPAHVRPHFTFYGLRFLKVEGIEPDSFIGYAIHSDLPRIGHIETDNAKVNKLIENAYWGQIGNFVDTPTDCPQRDERMGWTGDAHVFAPTASFNQYTPAFYAKFLHDMLLEQEKVGGAVAYVVPDVLDIINARVEEILAFEKESFGSCAWGDAATGIPWTLYTFYGDKALLKAQYPNMKLWTDWIRKQDDTHCGGRRLWTCGFHFADWLALDNPDPDSCLGNTDSYFVASAFYFYSADLTAKAAQALGYEEDARAYRALAEEVRAAFRAEYFTSTGRIAERTQTAMVLALFLDLVPDFAKKRLAEELKQKIESRGNHLDTGFVGTYFLNRALTKGGLNDLAYTLLLNEDYPGWLYEVNMGATTVWERWNSVLPDGSISGTGMNSLNHYAYGSIVEWIYRCVCGLNPIEEAPGFKRARIEIHADARLSYAKAAYDSAAGLYRSGWTRTEEGIEYHIEVPFDAEAEFIPTEKNGRYYINETQLDGPVALQPGAHTILWKA